MSASLKDVAAHAGVSVKTVSNVVHAYAHVTDATRSRVLAAIADLDYRPNLSARNLRKGRTGIIALALPELDLPYFAEVARGVIRAAEEHSWTVLIDQTEGLAERERHVVNGLRPQLVDGLILSPLALGADELAAREGDFPLVLLGERVHDGPADHVEIDNVAAARTATGHLLGLGRTRVAAIGAQPDPSHRVAHLRLAGYLEALAAAGVPRDDRLIAGAPSYRRADGAAAMAALLADPDPPDAVFCFNDLLALGALRVLHQRGLRVPEDVALVGFDDIEDGRFATPSLTTIAPDKEQIARLAVSLLVSRTDSGSELPPREVVAGHRLLVRESTVGC